MHIVAPMDELIDVRAIRERLGWTQKQLADYCCTDRSTVSRWETEPPAKGPAWVLLKQLRTLSTDRAEAAE